MSNVVLRPRPNCSLGVTVAACGVWAVLRVVAGRFDGPDVLAALNLANALRELSQNLWGVVSLAFVFRLSVAY